MRRWIILLVILAIVASACGASTVVSDDSSVSTTSSQESSDRVRAPQEAILVYIPSVYDAETSEEVELRKQVLLTFLQSAALVQNIEMEFRTISAVDFDDSIRYLLVWYLSRITSRWQSALNVARNKTHWFEVRDILNRLVSKIRIVGIAAERDSMLSIQGMLRDLLLDKEFQALVTVAMPIAEEVANADAAKAEDDSTEQEPTTVSTTTTVPSQQLGHVPK